MIEQINQGDKFICVEDFMQGTTAIFRKDDEYTSDEDHCITDYFGHDQFGWNLEVLNRHFKPLTVGEAANA